LLSQIKNFFGNTLIIKKTIFRFHFGTELVICWHVINVMAQSDEEYIKYSKYITDRTLLVIVSPVRIFPFSL
jgi:hypothetical protein